MTPTQLRAFVAIARTGSVKEAASELGVSEAAVSLHVGALRKELSDQLFTRAASGLAFTPGGLRLATRAAEMLGLQDQTVQEVSQAGHGRRLLRVAASSLFAEYAAPGLFELFTSRANDLDLELSVHAPSQFPALLTSRAVDAAIGPRSTAAIGTTLAQQVFLKYQLVLVAAPAHPLARAKVRAEQLREPLWFLGPSSTEPEGATARLLRHLEIPEDRQRIFQSHSAAIEEVKRGGGIGAAITFAAAADIAARRLVPIGARATSEGAWSIRTVPTHSVAPAAAELTRFISTPRATQAMLHGAGTTIGHFRPSVHVTLWS